MEPAVLTQSRGLKNENLSRFFFVPVTGGVIIGLEETKNEDPGPVSWPVPVKGSSTPSARAVQFFRSLNTPPLR